MTDNVVLVIDEHPRGCRIAAFVNGEAWPVGQEYIADITNGDPVEARRVALFMALRRIDRSFDNTKIELVGPSARG